MRKIHSALICGILAAMCFCSCKKKSNQLKCDLVSLTDSTTAVQSVTQFTYDNNDRLTSIVVSGKYACKRTLQYIDKAIIFTVSDTTPGISNEIDTAVLNNSGLIQQIFIHYTSSGSSSVENFFYDSVGVAAATRSVENENGVAGDTVEYVIMNGDLLYDYVKGQSVHKHEFTYYPTQDIVYGDPTYFRQLLYYGAYYYINKHMLSVLYMPGISYKAYTYTFDNDRIAQEVLKQWNAGSPDTVTHYINYSYSCK